MLKVTEIESCHLSTGQLLRLTKYSRKYTVMLQGTEELDNPELYRELDKNMAVDLYADILRNDVLS